MVNLRRVDRRSPTVFSTGSSALCEVYGAVFWSRHRKSSISERYSATLLVGFWTARSESSLLGSVRDVFTIDLDGGKMQVVLVTTLTDKKQHFVKS